MGQYKNLFSILEEMEEAGTKGDNPLVCYQFELASVDKSFSATNDFFHYSNKPK